MLKATELFKKCLSVREKSLSATYPHLTDGMAHFIQHDAVDYGKLFLLSVI